MGKIRAIEITFASEVELPDGFEHALESLVDMACKAWERQNPTMVMWPAGIGAAHTHPGWADENHPMQFDDSVLVIEVEAREDYTGNNPHNPNREELRAKYIEERAKAKLARTQIKPVEQQ